MARKLVSFDWAVKRLLRSKVNFVVLEGLLSELLKEWGGYERFKRKENSG